MPFKISSKIYIMEKYSVKNAITSGGFGTIYAVIEKATGRHYAMKTIKIQNQESYKSRPYDREIMIVEKLMSTPNDYILNYKEFIYDEVNAEYNIIMEYCPGNITIIS